MLWHYSLLLLINLSERIFVRKRQRWFNSKRPSYRLCAEVNNWPWTDSINNSISLLFKATKRSLIYRLFPEQTKLQSLVQCGSNLQSAAASLPCPGSAMSAPSLTVPVVSGLKSLFGGFWRRLNLPTLDIECSLLLAVPKQKVTHSRKRKRMATKQLKNIQHITKCPTCNGPKLAHTLCWPCFSKERKKHKLALRENLIN